MFAADPLRLDMSVSVGDDKEQFTVCLQKTVSQKIKLKIGFKTPNLHLVYNVRCREELRIILDYSVVLETQKIINPRVLSPSLRDSVQWHLQPIHRIYSRKF